MFQTVAMKCLFAHRSHIRAYMHTDGQRPELQFAFKKNEIKRDKEGKQHSQLISLITSIDCLSEGEKQHRYHFKFSKDQHWTKLFPKPLLTIMPQLFGFSVSKCQSLPGVLRYQVKAFSFPNLRLQHFPRLTDGFKRNQTFQIRYFIL